MHSVPLLDSTIRLETRVWATKESQSLTFENIDQKDLAQEKPVDIHAQEISANNLWQNCVLAWARINTHYRAVVRRTPSRVCCHEEYPTVATVVLPRMRTADEQRRYDSLEGKPNRGDPLLPTLGDAIYQKKGYRNHGKTAPSPEVLWRVLLLFSFRINSPNWRFLLHSLEICWFSYSLYWFWQANHGVLSVWNARNATGLLDFPVINFS